MSKVTTQNLIGASKWNKYSHYALGMAIALYAIQSGWIPNNSDLKFAANSYIFFVLVAIFCKLEAGIYQRNLMIQLELAKSTSKDGQ